MFVTGHINQSVPKEFSNQPCLFKIGNTSISLNIKEASEAIFSAWLKQSFSIEVKYIKVVYAIDNFSLFFLGIGDPSWDRIDFGIDIPHSPPGYLAKNRFIFPMMTSLGLDIMNESIEYIISQNFEVLSFMTRGNKNPLLALYVLSKETKNGDLADMRDIRFTEPLAKLFMERGWSIVKYQDIIGKQNIIFNKR